MNFTFTKDDLFLDIGDKYIFLMCFGGSPVIYLGYPFLKKYKFIFNQDSKTLGYLFESNGTVGPRGKEKEKEIVKKEKFKTIYIVLICVLSAILIGLGIFIYFFLKKKKKKLASELSEQPETQNNNEGLIPNEESN